MFCRERAVGAEKQREWGAYMGMRDVHGLWFARPGRGRVGLQRWAQRLEEMMRGVSIGESTRVRMVRRLLHLEFRQGWAVVVRWVPREVGPVAGPVS